MLKAQLGKAPQLEQFGAKKTDQKERKVIRKATRIAKADVSESVAISQGGFKGLLDESQSSISRMSQMTDQTAVTHMGFFGPPKIPEFNQARKGLENRGLVAEFNLARVPAKAERPAS